MSTPNNVPWDRAADLELFLIFPSIPEVFKIPRTGEKASPGEVVEKVEIPPCQHSGRSIKVPVMASSEEKNWIDSMDSAKVGIVPGFQITTANAKELAVKSAKVRRANAEARKNGDLVLVDRSAHAEEQAKSWPQLRLKRVRDEITKWDLELSRTRDAEKADLIARALKSLTEQERILDGRPLPGSLRPKAQRNGRPEFDPVPIEETSAPTEPPLSVPFIVW